MCLGAAAPCAHVTKFGLSRDPGFVVSFQLEFTSMLSRTPPPLPPPSLSLPSRSAYAYNPSRAPAPLPGLTGQPLAVEHEARRPLCGVCEGARRIFLRLRFYASGRLSLTSLYASTIFVRTSAGAFV